MKVECVIEKLKSIVPQVERVTGKNLALPVLNSILMVASGKTIKLRATNLDLGIEVELPAKIEKEGVVLVPGGLLGSVVATLYGAKNVVLEKVHGNLRLSTTINTLLLKTYPEDDFPTIPTVSGDEFTFSIDRLIRAFKDVAYSAALSDIKPEIASVYITEQGNDLVCVATDSFRLAEKKIKLQKPKHFHPLLIPIKNVNEIVRVLDGHNGDVRVVVGKNQISFLYENIYLTSRLIDGTFPDYKQIIPSEHTTKAVVLRQDIVNSLKAASVFSGKFNEVKIIINPKGKRMELHTKHQEIGENTTILEGTFSGDQIEANFNHKYLFDALQSIEDDSVALELTTPNKPMVMRGAHDQNFQYLVMPMNR
ncbi:DNA polymerase III subunit beta [Candidatus Parcubacteria bacterium]|nr:DNA polymerase III subunit beta [Candidatus Parcubacteria bacterium]